MSLKAKKNELVGQLESIGNLAKDRVLTSEERSKFDALDTEIKELNADIAREERSAELRKSVEAVVEQRVLPALGSKKDDTLEQFRNHIFKGLEARDLATGNGVLVPTSIDSAIRAVVSLLPGVEAEAGIKTIRGFESYPAFGTAAAAWVAEGGSVNVTNIATSSIELKPNAIAALGKISDRLALATGEDFVVDFVDTFAQALYKETETAYWSGSGVGQPAGLMTSAGIDGTVQSGSVSLTSGSAVVQQLNSVIYKMPAEYRSGAVWVASDAFLGAMAGMVDTTGRPLNLVTFVNGVPYINGYKVVSSPVAVASTAGTTVAAFVNLKQYRIAQFGNGAYIYKRLAEAYATSLASGHLLVQYKDARIGRSKGIVRVVAAA